VDDTPILGPDVGRRAIQQFIAADGPPAFAVRAQRVQEAFDALLAACRRKRDEYLKLTRTRLGMLHALAGDWSALRPLLQDDAQVALLQGLHSDLRPEPRSSARVTSSLRALRRALAEVIESLERFNRSWEEYRQRLDLRRVNALREGYNKYYVLEKECLLRSPRLARQGFQPLPPVTAGDVLAIFPLFSLPVLR
jgi:hypothetical protein